MKIAIVTLIGEFNYGNLLQSYALQTVLQRMGHDVCILNRRLYLPRKILFRRFLSFGKSLFKRFLLNDKATLVVSPFAEIYDVKNKTDCSNLKKFATQYLNRTVPLRSSDAMMKYALKKQHDAYIVGSDQVWREDYTLSIEENFLSFLSADCKVKRIAYAASFGTDNSPISQEKLSACVGLLKRFDIVSVREKSAVDMCANVFGVEACQVLDPTLLLTSIDYKKIFEKSEVSKSPGTLLTYILDDNENIKRKIEQFAKQYNLIPFSVNALEKIESLSYTHRQPSIEAWLRGFYDAEFVITDSFHACVFSILFNKPFVCLGNKERGNARFDSLLQMFGLQDRLVDINEFIDYEDKPIGWQAINEKLKQEREKIQKFLMRALS